MLCIKFKILINSIHYFAKRLFIFSFQPGIVGLVLIAGLTDHCCHLIIKCKYQAIESVMSATPGTEDSKTKPLLSSNSTRLQKSEEENEERFKIRQHLIRSMTYGDVGKNACGHWGLFIVNCCLIFTQFGFCLNYFIFVGNTISAIFPEKNVTIQANNSLPTPFPSVTIFEDENNTNSYTTSPTNSNSSLYQEVSEAPDLRLLVLSPLPIFAAFAILRDVRHLGFVSVGADISIFLGCVVTMVYIVVGKILDS